MKRAASWQFSLAMLVSLAIALSQEWRVLLWWTALGIAGCVYAVWMRETTARATLMRLLAANAFLLLLWLTLPWRWENDALVRVPEGMQLAARLSLRTNAIVLACSALLAGMETTAIAQAAAGLGLPNRFVHLSLLMVRYLDLLRTAQACRVRAARARGFMLRADRRTLALLGQQTGLLLVQALDRAEGVERAMRARGFTGAYRAPPSRPHEGGYAATLAFRLRTCAVLIGIAVAAWLAWLA